MKKFFTFLISAAITCTAGAAPQTIRKSTVSPVRPDAAVLDMFGSRKAPDAGSLSDLPLVTEIPSTGVTTTYSRNSLFFALSSQGQLYMQRDYGMIADIAVTDDNEVYIKNPFGGFNTGSYLTGTLADGKITVTFPQKVYVDEYPDWEADETGETMKQDFYYAFKMKYSTDGEKSKLELDMADPTVTFSVTEDGIYQDGDSYIGMVKETIAVDEATGEPQSLIGWAGFADTALDFNKAGNTPVSMPEGVKAEPWIMECGGDVKFVGIAIDGTDIYITDFLHRFSEGTIKGTIEGGKAVFETSQYLGQYNYWEHFAYFIPASYDPEAEAPDGFTVYTPMEKLEFSYDAEAKTLTAPENTSIVISTIPEAIYSIDAFDSPAFHWQDSSTPMELLTPEIVYYEYFDDMFFGAMAYVISPFAADGRLLNSENLYYNFYIDDEKLTLYPDEYTDLKEPMVNIPYAYEDSYIYFWGDSHEAVIFPTGFKKIGVGALYVNADGTETQSEIAWFEVEPTVSLDSVEAVREVRSVEYFDLSGRRIAEPAAGMAIRRTVFTDGTVSTDKVTF